MPPTVDSWSGWVICFLLLLVCWTVHTSYRHHFDFTLTNKNAIFWGGFRMDLLRFLSTYISFIKLNWYLELYLIWYKISLDRSCPHRFDLISKKPSSVNKSLTNRFKFAPLVVGIFDIDNAKLPLHSFYSFTLFNYHWLLREIPNITRIYYLNNIILF